MTTRSSLPIVFGLFLLGGCGRTGTGTVTVRFGDARNAGGAVRSALGSLPVLEFAGLRLISVTMEPDHDANGSTTGPAAFIFVNPECADDTETDACNLAGSGAPHEVREFFEFTAPQAANLAVGSQARTVPTGDYKYVSMMLCAGAPAEPNVKFRFLGGTDRTFALSMCAVTALAAEPIHIGAGDNVEVTLLYDPTDWITSSGDPERCDVSDSIQPRPPADQSAGWCLDRIAFIPTAALQ